jgi:hypothetical protein
MITITKIFRVSINPMEKHIEPRPHLNRDFYNFMLGQNYFHQVADDHDLPCSEWVEEPENLEAGGIGHDYRVTLEEDTERTETED